MADNKKAPPKKAQEEDKQVRESDTKGTEDEILGKFKSNKELAKAYEELESKLGTQGEEVRDAREFAQTVQPLLDEIRGDPELFKQLDERLRNKGQQAATSKADAKGDAVTTGQDEIRTVASDLILAKFEERHGIDKLSDSKRKEIRSKIGDVIYNLTGKALNGVDLRRLDSVLESSYIVANKEELIEKSKLEALASAEEAGKGGIPSVPSSPGKGESVLTSEEAKVAEKMGLSRKQYLEGKQS